MSIPGSNYSLRISAFSKQVGCQLPLKRHLTVPNCPHPTPSHQHQHTRNHTVSKQPVQHGKLTPQIQATKHFPADLHFGVTRSNYQRSTITSCNFYPSVSTPAHTETQQITEKQPGPEKGAWVSSPGRGQQQQRQLRQQPRQHRAPEQGSATHRWQRGAKQNTVQGQKRNRTRAASRQGEGLLSASESQRGFLGFSWSTQFSVWLFKRKGM